MGARRRLTDLLVGVVLVGVLAGALAVLFTGGGPITLAALALAPAGGVAGGLLGVRTARRLGARRSSAGRSSAGRSSAGRSSAGRSSARRVEREAEPTNTPIELVAADLRRLLRQHDLACRSLVPVSAKRMWALELGITHRAAQAAQALEVPHPALPAYRGLDAPHLGRLLRALAAEGMVLPRTAGLMDADDTR